MKSNFDYVVVVAEISLETFFFLIKWIILNVSLTNFLRFSESRPKTNGIPKKGFTKLNFFFICVVADVLFDFLGIKDEVNEVRKILE